MPSGSAPAEELTLPLRALYPSVRDLVRFSTFLVVALVVFPLADGSARAQVTNPDSARVRPADSAPTDLGLRVDTRIETKLERNRNERCTASLAVITPLSCRGAFQPIFDVQFNALANGVLAQRFHLDLDYDSEREFDASNNISFYYEGAAGERLQRVELGNVFFTPANSRFITSGIPAGNYGIQAIGQLGPMTLRLIAAQQKGQRGQTQALIVGQGSVQQNNARLEDFRFEARRFFFTIDPTLLPGYPNIDLLDTPRMFELAASLADTLRPTKVHLYRLLIGGQAPNPNGPRFIPRGARNENRGPAYEYLREGIDYIADPSQLWVALVRPLGLNERLVVAYNVLLPGGETVYPPTGGTPDLEALSRDQFANLLWDPEVAPGDAVFNREIRSAYRLGGEELQRPSLSLRIVTGTSGDQEKPVAGSAETYLQMFGLAQSTNSSAVDVENRVWPRPHDPNEQLGTTGGSQRLIRDYFLIFPSVRPFAAAGLVTPGNPSNDTLYTTPTQDINSPRRPQAIYQIVGSYASAGTGAAGTIQLQSLQLRRNAERVELDGRLLTRDVDYTIDYDLGLITLNRPDTLLLRPRSLVVQYEENPLFAEQPTAIYGASADFALDPGTLSFTAIRQQQRSMFNRPTLGFEPASSFVAGANADFSWDATGLTAFAQRFMSTSAPSRIDIRAEVATSRPDPNAENRAFLEDFEGEGGIRVSLLDQRWYFASQPAPSASRPAAVADSARAATLAWQNTGLGRNGELVGFRIGEIDPLTTLAGGSFGTPEPLLWLTLYPLGVGGARNASGGHDWLVPGAPAGQRWRSIRTVLGASGIDLTRVEYLQAWVLIDTSAARRSANPTLLVDLGDVSERSLTFSPDTMLVARNGGPTTVVGFRGKRFQGPGLDSERDPFTLTFDAGVNDVGLPGDRADRLVRRDAQTGAPLGDSTDVAVCTGDRTARAFGDTRINCTVRNDRLDEEDIDLDHVLSEREEFLRFAIDLSDPRSYTRVGGCIEPADPRNLPGTPETQPRAPLCWVQLRVPFSGASDTVLAPSLRRMKALRLTVVSGAGTPDDAFISLPISGLSLTGAPWLKRSETAIRGIGGDRPGGGFVIASQIGTQDSTSTLVYQPPPGVADEAASRQTEFGFGQTEINERSLRLLAGGLDVFDRAETYYRFPEGEKSFMGYEQLRVWARGRGDGWGAGGALEFYIKLGRDADNFYLYRSPVNAGFTQQAWDPEIRVDFSRFRTLRAEVLNARLQGSATISSGCTAVDSALILASLPAGSGTARYAACDDGYMVFTVDPNVNPPNLAAVQEMSVGIVRVAAGTIPAPSLLGDTLELWVDEIRLTGVVDEPGYAAYVGVDMRVADFMDLRVHTSRRDRNFRQLAEQPTFITQDAFDIASTFQLGKLLPQRLGLAVPLTISHRTQASDPFLLSKSDVLADAVVGLRTPRTSATAYALTLRRSEPLVGSPFGVVFNNLTVASTYATASSRSEYQRGEGDNFTVGLDYNVAADPRAVRIPAWLDRAVTLLPDWILRTPPLARFREAEYRYNPAQLRFTSAFAHATDDRVSFSTPASAPTDVGRIVRGLNHVWRNTSAIDLRPVDALQLRWDINSLRDLRNYGDTTAAGRAASDARRGLLGQDLGLERERTMNAFVRLAPPISTWISPIVSLASEFTMTRDPNARSLLQVGSGPDDVRIARRVNNRQTFDASGSINLEQGLTSYLGGIPGVARLARGIEPVTISYSRSLFSSFDRASEMPPPSFQFALGGVGDFRSLNADAATSAGVTNTLQATNTLVFPLGLSLTGRFVRADTRNWTRRLQNQQSVLDGSQRTFPDLSLRWSWRPPPTISPVLSAIGAGAQFRRTTGSTLAPPLVPGGNVDRADRRLTTYPMSLNATWGMFGGFATAGSYSVSETEDFRPGSALGGTTREYGADLSKTFAPRPGWRLPGDLRTRLSWQRSQTDSRVLTLASGTVSKLTDNGRYSMALTMDTDVSETASFSLLGQRTVTFDENFNRRNTMTVISAVLHLKFFGGTLR